MPLDVELTEVRDFLAATPPFDELPAAELARLVPALQVQYFRRGTSLITRGVDNHVLYVVRSGAVDIHDGDDVLVERAGEGATLGSITLVMGNPSTFEVTAIEDTLVLAMDAAVFYELCRRHTGFAHHFDEQRASRMQGAVARQQLSDTGPILKTRVSELLRGEPVTIDRFASIREAAIRMSEGGVSSLLVLDAGAVAGIVTDRDLRHRVLAAELDPGFPIDRVMTKDPIMVAEDAMAFEVLLEMVGRNIHHVPVVADGQPLGIVTTTDIMRMAQANPVYLVGDIGKQQDVAGVAQVSARLPEVVDSLVRQDASAEDIGRVVTAIGDATERRLIALAEAELGPPPVPYCWVALGSRARSEQALGADQDNAIIIDDRVETVPEAKAWFEELAARVTAGLEESGYPRCPGDVMATNPRCRVPLRQWRTAFRTWLSEPEPQALLSASIFFDMRPVAGDASLCTTLTRFVRATAPKSTLFLAHLTKQAVQHEPPLGFFRGFVLEKKGEHANTLDIKAGGIGAVVELARVHALAVGTPAVGTRERIRAAVTAGVMGEDRAQDLLDAFEFISYVRFRHQATQVRGGRAPDNHLSPDELSSFDKRHLREAFGIVRAGQSALTSLHPLQYIS